LQHSINQQEYLIMSIAQTITDNIIKQLEAGTAPWVRPWHSNGIDAPYNPVAKRYYNGINFIHLSMMPASTNYWCTYKQAQSVGAQVKKGSKGIQVVYFSPLEIHDKTSDEIKKIPMLKTYTVFNADQIEGLELPANNAERSEIETIESCEDFIRAQKARISFGGNRAFYAPSIDAIQLPERTQFKSTADYYATTLHELAHWTGHESRLNRSFGKRFGNQAYAFEELVAELGSAMLCAHLKIDGQLQHASYIANWLEVLKNDPKNILKAGALAQKILDFTTKEEA
jgi:antirestriction protein ArdC